MKNTTNNTATVTTNPTTEENKIMMNLIEKLCKENTIVQLEELATVYELQHKPSKMVKRDYAAVIAEKMIQMDVTSTPEERKVTRVVFQIDKDNAELLKPLYDINVDNVTKVSGQLKDFCGQIAKWMLYANRIGAKMYVDNNKPSTTLTSCLLYSVCDTMNKHIGNNDLTVGYMKQINNNSYDTMLVGFIDSYEYRAQVTVNNIVRKLYDVKTNSSLPVKYGTVLDRETGVYVPVNSFMGETRFGLEKVGSSPVISGNVIKAINKLTLRETCVLDEGDLVVHINYVPSTGKVKEYEEKGVKYSYVK